MTAETKKQIGLFSLPVLVAALGYFVDIYDLLLFTQIRIESLTDIGVKGDAINTIGSSILNWQMIGLLIGGILWGMLGDRKGRLSVLFGSILLYSAANIANGFVHTVPQYEWCRLIAGIGLAGELGAGITLVSELVPKEKRGMATSIVAGVGLSGAVAAYFIHLAFHWQACFFIGGGMGIVLLLMRVSVFESGMYKDVEARHVKRGNFLMLFATPERAMRYLKAIAIGLPTWYVIGRLLNLANKYGDKFHMKEAVDPARAVMFAYIAISVGDLLIGFISHWFKSRKKALFLFYGFTVIGLVLFFRLDGNKGSTVNEMYAVCAFLGFATGFWAIFVTMAAEQFGTNLRSTATTTVPNMVRGSLVFITMLSEALEPSQGYVHAAIITGVVVMAISVLAAVFTKETFGKDLDFIEE